MQGLDSQTSTVLLLIVLGFLIYSMCSPNTSNESFEETAAPTKNKQVTFAPTMSVQSEQTMMKPIMKQLEAESVKPRGATLPTLLPQTVTPSARPSVGPSSCSGPNNYDPFSGEGSSLEDAFSNDMNLTPDVSAINMHQKENKNYKADDFLPKETNPTWFDTSFAKYSLNDDQLINTERYVIGVNTVGQSLKNGSHDIRGTIPNPKFSVSPWNNSTYEADFNIKSLC
jgi:hypothetical protein